VRRCDGPRVLVCTATRVRVRARLTHTVVARPDIRPDVFTCVQLYQGT
jgi:hypothetical protein